MNGIHILCSAFIDLLFPQASRVCRYDHISSQTLAATARGNTMQTSLPCLAPLPYSNTLVRGAIHAAKYSAHTVAAKKLGEAIAPFLAEELAERRMFGAYIKPILIPVPLHDRRRRERGFNQVSRIATALLEELGDETAILDERILLRIKYTNSQTGQATREDRIANMRGAFSVVQSEYIQDQEVILLDDVITTGATLEAARSALLAAGARTVLCVAVAH